MDIDEDFDLPMELAWEVLNLVDQHTRVTWDPVHGDTCRAKVLETMVWRLTGITAWEIKEVASGPCDLGRAAMVREMIKGTFHSDSSEPGPSRSS